MRGTSSLGGQFPIDPANHQLPEAVRAVAPLFPEDAANTASNEPEPWAQSAV